MTRQKMVQRISTVFLKLSSSKVFSFVISVALLLALDLALMPGHRLHWLEPSARATSSSKSVSSALPIVLLGFALLEALVLVWVFRYSSELRAKLEAIRLELQTSNAANQTKSLFLANTSHEIRTPLGAILGFTKLLQDPLLSAADREVYVSIIQRTGESLNSIINDILDLSKVEAGHLQVEKSWVLFRPLMDEVLKICEGKFGKQDVKVVLDYCQGVDELIFTDPTRLQQILINVLGNALKFTEQGKIAVYIEQQPRHLNIKIRDSGVGISAEDQARLFQSFSQIENSLADTSEGTGLGLVLSRNLARLMGGELYLEYSRPGAGSSFVLSIPREIAITAVHTEREMAEGTNDARDAKDVSGANESVLLAKPSIRDVSEGVADVPAKKVLLVDDSEINRLLMKRILHQRGLRVETANNGQEAIDLAMGGDFDALLMDVQMPVKNGHEAARELRQRGYDRPIIALTAHAMKEDRDRCLEAGYSDYLSKPIRFEDLYSTLARAIDLENP